MYKAMGKIRIISILTISKIVWFYFNKSRIFVKSNRVHAFKIGGLI